MEINAKNGKDSFAHRHRNTSAFHSCACSGCLLSSVGLRCSFFFVGWFHLDAGTRQQIVAQHLAPAGLKTVASVQLDRTV